MAGPLHTGPMSEPAAGPRPWLSLALVAKVTGVAALTLAALEFGTWVASFGIVDPVIAVVGADGIIWIFEKLWVVAIAASFALVAGLITGWRLHKPRWAPGVGLVAVGVLLNSGWSTLDRYVDLWGLSRFGWVETPEANGQLIWVAQLATLTNRVVSLAVIVLLLRGGRLLLGAGGGRHPKASPDGG